MKRLALIEAHVGTVRKGAKAQAKRAEREKMVRAKSKARFDEDLRDDSQYGPGAL